MFHGRRSVAIENAALRLTVLEGGGHIAEVLDKRSGVSPLWVPPWRSITRAASALTRLMICSTTSGSADSFSAVYPQRSENITVT